MNSVGALVSTFMAVTIMIFFIAFVGGAHSDCVKKKCPVGMVPKFVQYSCFCAVEAK